MNKSWFTVILSECCYYINMTTIIVLLRCSPYLILDEVVLLIHPLVVLLHVQQPLRGHLIHRITQVSTPTLKTYK